MGRNVEGLGGYKVLRVEVRFSDGSTSIFSGFSIPWKDHGYVAAHAYCMEGIRGEWGIEIDYTNDGGLCLEINRVEVLVTSWPHATTTTEMRRFVNKIARRYYRFLTNTKSRQ